MEDEGAEQANPEAMVTYPLLMECDVQGRVLWMSDRTQQVLQHPEGQTAEEAAAPPSRLPSEKLPVDRFQFWRVLEMGDRMLIGAQSREPAASIALRELSEVLRLEARMLRHYFRLQKAERAIADRARKPRRDGGGKALRLVEMERQRVGRELHTGVGQLLAAIRLHLEVISAHLPEPPTRVRLALDHIDELAVAALQQVRSVSQRLHPPEWQRLTLSAALQQLWLVSGITQKFMGSLRLDPLPSEPSLEVKILIYRAAQEALSNLLRHSQAGRVEMVLERRRDQLVLTVTDDGVGFDVAAFESAPPSVSSGLGLRSIRDLATGLGGGIMIESGSSGTKLKISVPAGLPDA